ncbi:DUF6192 family protein [Streptomyces sp. NBC_00335]|uniref:DUF6192 family protein n=1 Tax=unclassified Streptomyces TaxID=2593676 RepID=UPI00224F6817|nr:MULTISPECIES: DUF6192 family protein [unclassified Streptomyces]MCX5406575.1 DUF6192 family protein [Streptomyces sp. NBC_00086]
MPTLEIPDGFAREQWTAYVHRARRAVRSKSASNFEIGDILNEMLEGRPRGDGEITRIRSLFSRQIRVKETTLAKYLYVTRAWPPDTRRDDVPWTVHEILAGQSNRFQLIREEPSDDLDPHHRGAWHYDAAKRARHSLPHVPATPTERIDTAKRLLRDTKEAAEAVTQLADRTEVLKAAVEDPAFRRAVRDAHRDRARRMEREAEAQWGVPGPVRPSPEPEPALSETGPTVSYRETASSVLRILGQCTSFCVSMQNAVVLAQEELLTTEEEEAVLDSIKKVRAVCDWCEHVVTTGQTDMDDELARLLGGGKGEQP